MNFFNLLKVGLNAKNYIRLYGKARRNILKDEYIQWLMYANAGMINEGNIYLFDYVIKNVPSNKPILEIGSFCGLSLNIMNYLLFKHSKNNKLFSADPWFFEGYYEGKIGDSNIEFKIIEILLKNLSKEI